MSRDGRPANPPTRNWEVEVVPSEGGRLKATDGTRVKVPFPLLLALLQMPHIDVVEEVQKRKGGPLTAEEHAYLNRRISSALCPTDGSAHTAPAGYGPTGASSSTSRWETR